MSQAPRSTDDLQFNTVEPANQQAAAAGHNCALCGQPIVSQYYALGDQPLCPQCCDQVNAPVPGSGIGRLIKASVMGLVAGLVGALIWFAIRRLAHLEIGLVAILVGFMVGIAVRKGSGGRGGLGYQVLAVVLTYCCIAANYMPDIIEGALADARQNNQAGAPAVEAGGEPAQDAKQAANANADPEPAMGTGELIGAIAVFLLVVFALAMAAPFLAGVQNLIGLLIIGFALWEAWKLNAYRQLPITGPYQMAPPPAA